MYKYFNILATGMNLDSRLNHRVELCKLQPTINVAKTSTQSNVLKPYSDKETFLKRIIKNAQTLTCETKSLKMMHKVAFEGS